MTSLNLQSLLSFVILSRSRTQDVKVLRHRTIFFLCAFTAIHTELSKQSIHCMQKNLPQHIITVGLLCFIGIQHSGETMNQTVTMCPLAKYEGGVQFCNCGLLHNVKNDTFNLRKPWHLQNKVNEVVLAYFIFQHLDFSPVTRRFIIRVQAPYVHVDR